MSSFAVVDDLTGDPVYCYYCGRIHGLQWAAVWAMWLCGTCRPKRTEAELRYHFENDAAIDAYMRPKVVDMGHGWRLTSDDYSVG